MRLIFLIALFIATACAPIPVPTTTPPHTSTPRRTASPQPTFIAREPTATQTPTRESTRTLTPTLTLTPMPLTFERNPRAILIEADVANLATMPRDAHVPVFRLYADGLLVFAGESASRATGLDASVRVARLSDSQVQDLLTALDRLGFFALKDFYEPRPKPSDAPTARISIFLNRAKTVQVYAPDADDAPKIFTAAFDVIQQAIPADAPTFLPSEGFLIATPAGTTSELGASVNPSEWKNSNIRLADADDGIAIFSNAFASVANQIASAYPNVLFREGERVYRVRFAPTLPRAPHLSDSVATILNAPREFDGRQFDIIGYFRGWNVYGEARGNPPVSRNDWVIADANGAMYVTGAMPRGLDPSSRADAWTVIRLRAVVNYVRLGTSHLEARRVEILQTVIATPTPGASLTPTPLATRTPTIALATATRAPTRTPIVINSQDAAIAAIKTRFPEIAHIKATPRGTIGATTNITVLAPRQNEWWVVFWEGSGDCPAGCINNRYWYFVVDRDGRVTPAGEYSRVFIAEKNAFEEKGSPMWGVP
ncbi:MAG: hypothetical protein HZC40_00475 [Chloroflexi bacterium]|nr:hypothetical protein [Chloroflexota bacterium]